MTLLYSNHHIFKAVTSGLNLIRSKYSQWYNVQFEKTFYPYPPQGGSLEIPREGIYETKLEFPE